MKRLVALTFSLVGCWVQSTMPESYVLDRLEKCRTEAREAFYVQHKSARESELVYQRCVEREGVE